MKPFAVRYRTYIGGTLSRNLALGGTFNYIKRAEQQMMKHANNRLVIVAAVTRSTPIEAIEMTVPGAALSELLTTSIGLDIQTNLKNAKTYNPETILPLLKSDTWTPLQHKIIHEALAWCHARHVTGVFRFNPSGFRFYLAAYLAASAPLERTHS